MKWLQCEEDSNYRLKVDVNKSLRFIPTCQLTHRCSRGTTAQCVQLWQSRADQRVLWLQADWKLSSQTGLCLRGQRRFSARFCCCGRNTLCTHQNVLKSLKRPLSDPIFNLKTLTNLAYNILQGLQVSMKVLPLATIITYIFDSTIILA